MNTLLKTHRAGKRSGIAPGSAAAPAILWGRALRAGVPVRRWLPATLWCVWVVVSGSPVAGQVRQQFPAPLVSDGWNPAVASAAGAPSTFAPSSTPTLSAPSAGGVTPGVPVSPPGGYGFGGSPATLPTSIPTTPSGGMPLSGMPISVPPASPALPPGVAPGAALQGNIQTPPAWDPFASPGMTPPPDSIFAAPATGMAASTKLFDKLRFDYDWIARDNSSSGFGSNDIELAATFGFPLLSIQTPFLITPGFGMHFWDGPVSASTNPADVSADMPPAGYDAYLDVAWNPSLNPQFGAELDVRVGVYSDFDAVTSDSVRVTGKGMAVLTLTPTIQIKGGVWYLDRNRVKLLPAGGVIWTPNSDTRLEILFPNPKLAKKLTVIGDAEWWYYIRGWYGGGNWTIRRAFGGAIESVDYNDIRIALGVDCLRKAALSGYGELGVSFNRQIIYRESPQDSIDPSTTIFLGAGLHF